MRFGDGDDDAEEPGAVADDDFGAYIDSNERAAWAGGEDDADAAVPMDVDAAAPTASGLSVRPLAPCDDVSRVLTAAPTTAAHEATGA